MSELKLKIVTPDRVFFDDAIDMLIARGINGDFAIMKNHVPMMAVLDIRYLKIKIKGEYKHVAIAGGYLTFKDNQITIMSSACEWRDEIDKERALQAKLKAQELLEKAKQSYEGEIDKAELALRKAINRLDVSGK